MNTPTTRNVFRFTTLLIDFSGVLFLGVIAFGYSVHAQMPPKDIATSTETAEMAAELTPEKGYTVESLGETIGKSPSDFVVGPGKTELTINPGESKTVELLVSNRTGTPRRFNFQIEDAAGSVDLTQSVTLLGDDTGPYTLKDYIHLPAMSIDLNNNERARIPVTITVPKDAEAGGRYGSVLVTTATKDAGNAERTGTAPASAIVSRIGTLFFLTIPGDTKVEGKLQNFDTISGKHVFSEGPINFQILFNNTGNLHLNPYGEVSIKNFAGEEVGFVQLDPWFALPRSTRAREVQWDRELLIGRYEATVKINRGYGDIIDTQSVYFWVLPWKIIALVFGVLFVLFALIRFIAQNFEFKKKEK